MYEISLTAHFFQDVKHDVYTVRNIEMAHTGTKTLHNTESFLSLTTWFVSEFTKMVFCEAIHRKIKYIHILVAIPA